MTYLSENLKNKLSNEIKGIISDWYSPNGIGELDLTSIYVCECRCRCEIYIYIYSVLLFLL